MVLAKRSDGDAGQQTDENGRFAAHQRRNGPQTRAILTPQRSRPGPGASRRAADPDRMTDPEAPERRPATGLTLAAVALVWMAAMLWSPRATITGRAGAEMEVPSTAYALPGAVSAALVAGAAAGLAVVTLLT